MAENVWNAVDVNGLTKEEQVYALMRKLYQPVDYIGSKFSDHTLEEVVNAGELTSLETQRPANSLYEELRQLLAVVLGETASSAAAGKKEKKVMRVQEKTKEKAVKKALSKARNTRQPKKRKETPSLVGYSAELR